MDATHHMKSNSNCFPSEECGDIGIWIIKRLDLTISVSEKFYTRQIEALSKKILLIELFYARGGGKTPNLRNCEKLSWVALMALDHQIISTLTTKLQFEQIVKKNWVNCQKWLLKTPLWGYRQNLHLNKLQKKLHFERIFNSSNFSKLSKTWNWAIAEKP